jgi:hypothetical protein
MTKGAAFCYAVVVGAAGNFVIDYIHHREDATPVVARDTAPEREHAAIAPSVRPEPRVAEPRIIEPRVPEHPTAASLPPVREIKPLPEPAIPAALPQVPMLPMPKASAMTALPPSADLPTPPLKPTSVPNLSAAPPVVVTEPPADRPGFSVPLAAPAAASAVPLADKPADKPVEAMSTPAPTLSIGNPVSLLPPPDKPADPPAPKTVKPASGTGGLY